MSEPTFPSQHTHRVSFQWLDTVSDEGERLLMCSVCDALWHTGLVDRDDVDVLIEDLILAAVRYEYARRAGVTFGVQLTLIAPVVDGPIRVRPHRAYRQRRLPVVGQLPLPLAA